MEIKEVKTSKEIREFIRFPKKLYRHCPYYVPPLDQGEYNILTKHPALSFCELKMWLAYQDGIVVGRIAGVINRKCNEIKQQLRIRFAWFDVVDDVEVARALFQKVEEWGRQNHLTEICGPSRFSNMEKQAMLVDGFDHTVSIGADYNFPYYPQLMEQLGFEKEVDYIQYRVKVGEIPEKFSKLAALLSERYNVRLRKFKNKRELRQYGMEYFQLINRSYVDIFNFIPLTDEEIEWTINENFQVANVDLSSVLEDENGRVVGFAFCLPSLSEAFQKAKGKMFPLGWYYILKALKKNKLVDMYITGVLPEYLHSGIHAIYHRQLHENFLKMGFEYALASQQLETNVAARVWNKYDSEPYFKRRCYKKEL
ncbi:MAG: N-acetyltransferase [Bacteroidales bacterium]|nr:N-acetyltransferase [Bacteroidales bacterium]